MNRVIDTLISDRLDPSVVATNADDLGYFPTVWYGKECNSASHIKTDRGEKKGLRSIVADSESFEVTRMSLLNLVKDMKRRYPPFFMKLVHSTESFLIRNSAPAIRGVEVPHVDLTKSPL
jgi:hypothetical protein